MKSTIISMLVVLVLLVTLPMIFLGDHNIAGRFLDFGKPAAKGVALPDAGIKTVTTDSVVQMYKWRDANGIMQFSNILPAHGEAELIQLTPNLSTIEAVKVPKKATTTATVTASPELGNPYTPGGMKQMVEQANALKGMMNQKQVEQQKVLDNITQR